MTPEKLADAMDRLHIHSNGRYNTDIADKWVEPDKWFVVDERTAEPEVNWPGELVSEHDSAADARIGLATAIIHMASN